MLYGIDLSHHNSDEVPVNFDLLRGHVDFIVSKITQGTDFVDGRGAWHVSETRRIGAIPGMYHFPDWGNAVDEAHWFAQHCGDVSGAFIAFDCEAVPGGLDPVAWSLAFMGTARDLLGVKPLIYLNKSLISGHNWAAVINSDFGLWEANYDGNAVDFGFTGAWPAVAIKQYSDRASVNGVTGGVDADSFNGSRAQLLAYCKSGAPVPTPSPKPTPVVTPWSVLPSLVYGMRNSPKVRSLQSFLNRTFPAYAREHGKLDVTGNYLDVTTAWVREFQQRTGIRSGDGRNIGPLTKAKLWSFGWRG